jgi:hypothetical protein
MVQTFEAVYEGGAIRLPDNIRLPENTRVYVVVPEVATTPVYHIHSPRLVDVAQAGDFVKEVVEANMGCS